MSNNTTIRTQMLLAILFPPMDIEVDSKGQHYVIESDQELGERLYHEAIDDDRPEEDPRAWWIKFNYTNQAGKTREWSVDLYQAVYFTFRTAQYMVVRGERNGPVCFRLDKLPLEVNIEEIRESFDFQEADPDCFPTEDTQDWLLKQQGF